MLCKHLFQSSIPYKKSDTKLRQDNSVTQWDVLYKKKNFFCFYLQLQPSSGHLSASYTRGTGRCCLLTVQLLSLDGTGAVYWLYSCCLLTVQAPSLDGTVAVS